MQYPTVSALLLAAGAVAAAASGVTPLQKVVEMLGDMEKKAGEDKHAEQVQWVGYRSFCDHTNEEKTTAIAKAADRIEALTALKLKCDTDVERLGGEIRGHEADITGWDADQTAADKVRDGEKDQFLAARTDLSESVQAIGHALVVLKQQWYDRPGSAVSSSLLQTLERVAPEVPVTAYATRSGDIIKMLEGLETKFKDELDEADRQEVSRKAAYTGLTQDLKFSVDNANARITEKDLSSTKLQQQSNEAAAELEDVTTAKADDEKYLKDLIATCAQKQADYDSRQQLRTEEIGALQKAQEILASSKVTVASDHLPKLLQKKASVLAQLRADSLSPNQEHAIAFLRQASSRLNSEVLSMLVASAQADPFAKVKQLIQELIDRLMTQATNEATHKGWCDTELGTNANTRKSKTAEIDTLHAEIDGLGANVAQLAKRLGELEAAIAFIDAAVGEATDLRAAEAKDNAQTIADAKDGQAALTEAIKVLKDFYGGAKDATAMAQTSVKQEPPPIFDEPYQGQQAASGGVVGMLEVIHSDFARLEKDTSDAEAASLREYDAFMEDSEIDKTEKVTSQKHMTSDRLAKEALLQDKQEQLQGAEKTLNVALASWEKLKPACDSQVMSYEERKGRRKDEIEALKEALRILSGDDSVLGAKEDWQQ